MSSRTSKPLWGLIELHTLVSIGKARVYGSGTVGDLVTAVQTFCQNSGETLTDQRPGVDWQLQLQAASGAGPTVTLVPHPDTFATPLASAGADVTADTAGVRLHVTFQRSPARQAQYAERVRAAARRDCLQQVVLGVGATAYTAATGWLWYAGHTRALWAAIGLPVAAAAAPWLMYFCGSRRVIV